MNENIKKMFVTYKTNEDGTKEISKVYAVTDDGIIDEDFDANVHPDKISAFLNSNGISGSNPLAEAEEKGLYANFDENNLDSDTLKEFVGEEKTSDNVENSEDKEDPVVVPTGDDNQNDDENELSDDEDLKKDKKIGKKVMGGVLLGGTVTGLALGVTHCSKQQVEEAKENQNVNDLYQNMTEEQKAFFQPTFEAVEAFNQKAADPNNFALEQDKTTLYLTVDEAMSLNVLMNNYTAEELFDIFGTREFTTTNVMENARNAYSKLSTYYMNAKEPSGLSSLINDEKARDFFERHENAVIAFNNNPSIELSDQVIKNLYYDYVYTGAAGNYTDIKNPGVAWIATSSGFGFELANRNIPEYKKINNISEEEKAKYGEAVAEKGLELRKITNSELLSDINEEIEIGTLDEIDNKSLCALATTKTRDSIEALTNLQQINQAVNLGVAKDDLEEGLKEIGASSDLINKVKSAGINISQELLDEISAYSSDANELVDNYNSSVGSYQEKEAILEAAISAARDKYNGKGEIDLDDLVNNRFRTLQKENDKDNDKKSDLIIGKDKNDTPIVDGEKFDDLSEEEQKEFIKDEGKLVEETTTTTEVKVDKEDLTQEEQQQVTSQEKVLKEIENVSNQYIEAGVKDAISYTESSEYDFKNDNVTNPYNNEKKNIDDMSLFNGVSHGMAFGDASVVSEINKINSSDAQIQEAMNKYSKDELAELKSLLSSDAESYLKNKYGNDWVNDFMDNSYDKAFEQQVDGSLDSARDLGGQLKESAKTAYEKAQAEADRKNEEEAKNQTTPTPSTPTPTPSTTPEPTPTPTPNPTPTPSTSEDDYDPNLDPNFGADDEIPYEIDKPVYYVSESEWANAYGDGTSKTR